MYKTNPHKYGVALLLCTFISGCATSSPPTSLQRMKMSMVSRLAADCYWEHEGERFVFGPAPVWSACRRWAQKAVNGQQALVAGVEVQNR